MSSPGVVEALDVLEQGESGVGFCGKTPAIKQFAFQAGEEALAQGVVIAVAEDTARDDTIRDDTRLGDDDGSNTWNDDLDTWL